MSAAGTTAVLICDLQYDILAGFDESTQAALLSAGKTILAAARSKGILPVFVRVAFRPGYPEINPRNLVQNRP